MAEERDPDTLPEPEGPQHNGDGPKNDPVPDVSETDPEAEEKP